MIKTFQFKNLFIILFIISLSTAAEIKSDQGVADADGKTVWYDGKLLTIEGKGWQDTKSYYDRVPAKAEGEIPKHVWGLSHHSAGMNLRFSTNADTIKVRWIVLNSGLAMPHMAATGVSGVDLYSKTEDGGWRFLHNGRPTADTNLVRFRLNGADEYILYLPLYNGIKKLEIGIAKDKRLFTIPADEKRQKKTIVFYGTSITQGGCASRPGTAFTNIVSRNLKVPVINLGFSGNGKMELVMADLIAELDPAVYVLDCLWNMNQQMITERFETFIRKLRAKKPNTAIVLAEDCNVYDISPTGKGKVAFAIYEKLVKEGMKNLYYLPNKGMLGTDGEGTVDGCHPTDLGMMRMAGVFTEFLEKFVK